MATILIHPAWAERAGHLAAVQSLASQLGSTPVISTTGRHLRLERPAAPARRTYPTGPFGGDAA